MSENINDIIDLVHPTVSGIGIITTDQIWILFDREMDEDSLTNGSFFVEGPDFDTSLGPGLEVNLGSISLGTESEVLQSPGYHGIVQGTFEFKRLSLDTLDEVDTLDVLASGHLYRTKAIFTPTNRLQASTDYRIYLTGDVDGDEASTGICERTVYDTVEDVAGGSGSVEFVGSYDGTLDSDTYTVEIATAGDLTTAKFIFTKTSDGTPFGPFKVKQVGVYLGEGVTAKFSDGLYEVGDTWHVLVKAPEVFSSNLTWPFKTGSGNVEELPDTSFTTVLGTTLSTSGSTASTFTVESTNPEDGASNLPIVIGEWDIVIDFDSDIDVTSVASGINVSVFAESVDGDTSIVAGGLLVSNPTVDGSSLHVVIQSGVLHENNLVTVTLDSTITGTNGVSLDEDYEFQFSTSYSPMYCTLRRIKLNIGAYIDGIPDDTINLAIWEASREAEMLTWNKDNLTDEYYMFARSQWTCCRAAQILLINTTGNSGLLKRKKLDNLEVEYNPPQAGQAGIPLKRAEDCMLKWEGAIQAGGRQVQGAQAVIKGELDPDRPMIGRGWDNSDYSPIANTKFLPAGFRRYKRGWWNRG